ncbi:MAG: hypothetical protein JXA25_05415 [Anaerolineales bacterium]|nr:hypothetical protein [Anaerolineales bacterium]
MDKQGMETVFEVAGFTCDGTREDTEIVRYWSNRAVASIIARCMVW